MKLIGLILSGILFVSFSSYGQSARERADRMVDRIDDKIDLSDSQEDKLEVIYTDFFVKLDELKKSGASKYQEKSLWQTTNESVMNVLSPNQQEIFKSSHLNRHKYCKECCEEGKCCEKKDKME